MDVDDLPKVYNIPIEEQDRRLEAQHDETEHLAIRNTLVRRITALAAYKIASRISWIQPGIIPVCGRFIIKTGPWVHLAEAKAMEFVAQQTSLPVPKVYCSFIHKNHAYIVMERIQGKMLWVAWCDLSKDARRKVLAQLRQMMDELRTVKPTTEGVESCTGGSLRDCRIAHCLPRMGPFKTFQAFHMWLRQGLRLSEVTDHSKLPEQDYLDIVQMVDRQDGPWGSPVLTHGDLNPFNIIIRGDKVAGIIDWESSGWYPDYWEYTNAWTGNILREEWQDNLEGFLNAYPEDLQMEKIRQKWWGEY